MKIWLAIKKHFLLKSLLIIKSIYFSTIIIFEFCIQPLQDCPILKRMQHIYFHNFIFKCRSNQENRMSWCRIALVWRRKANAIVYHTLKAACTTLNNHWYIQIVSVLTRLTKVGQASGVLLSFDIFWETSKNRHILWNFFFLIIRKHDTVKKDDFGFSVRVHFRIWSYFVFQHAINSDLARGEWDQVGIQLYFS